MKSKFFKDLKKRVPEYQKRDFMPENVRSLLKESRVWTCTEYPFSPEDKDFIHSIDYITNDPCALEKLLHLTHTFVESGRTTDASILVYYHDLPLGDELAFALIDWAILIK